MPDITPTKLIDANELKNKIAAVKWDPSEIQATVLDYLSAATDGVIDIVDPTNPFIFLLTSSCVCAATAINEAERINRLMYPTSAMFPDELYHHMSDRDYLNRFSTPARTKMKVMLQQHGLMTNMVDCPSENCYKLTIPRETRFDSSDTHFTMLYPVDVRRYYNGVFTVTYDTGKLNEILPLSSNVIEFSFKTEPTTGYAWIFFEVDIIQLTISSTTFALNSGLYFSEDIPFTDRYYTADVYYRSNKAGSDWMKIKTTHSDLVYDYTVPTAVLKVVGKTLKVSVPSIYTTSGLVNGELRLDLFSTKGEIFLNLANTSIQNQSVIFRALDESNDINEYTNAIVSTPHIFYSDSVVTGGSNGMSFTELRDRVINNSVGAIDLPITNTQLVYAMKDLGYGVVRNVDVVTNRIMLAVRDTPNPTTPGMLTPANITMSTLVTKLGILLESNTCKVNGNRYTLCSNSVYRNNNGSILKVDDKEIENYRLLSSNEIPDKVNSAEYLYSPFYYVLDNSQNEFETRAYHLDDPVVSDFGFIYQNPDTLERINTTEVSIEKSSVGYKILTTVSVSADYAGLSNDKRFAQLSFIPVGETTRAAVNGEVMTLPGTQQVIFMFDILTNHDIDSNDVMSVSNFSMYKNGVSLLKLSLDTEFKLIYGIASRVTGIRSSIDDSIADYLLPYTPLGLTEEKVVIKLGYPLKGLWSRTRTIATGLDYKKYQYDIPDVYQDDIYGTFDDGLKVRVNPDGVVEYNKLHSKGDVVTDSSGNVVYKHRAGETIIDTDGRPIVETELSPTRYIDILTVDGCLLFANDTPCSQYRKELRSLINDWINTDMSRLNDMALDQTKIFFHPRKSSTSVDVYVDSVTKISIDPSQELIVDLHVSSLIFVDAKARYQLTANTAIVIAKAVAQSEVSITEITANLRAIYGNSVSSVKVYGLGGGLNLERVKLAETDTKLSLKKRLVLKPDGTFTVQDAVTVNFIQMR